MERRSSGRAAAKAPVRYRYDGDGSSKRQKVEATTKTEANDMTLPDFEHLGINEIGDFKKDVTGFRTAFVNDNNISWTLDATIKNPTSYYKEIVSFIKRFLMLKGVNNNVNINSILLGTFGLSEKALEKMQMTTKKIDYITIYEQNRVANENATIEEAENARRIAEQELSELRRKQKEKETAAFEELSIEDSLEQVGLKKTDTEFGFIVKKIFPTTEQINDRYYDQYRERIDAALLTKTNGFYTELIKEEGDYNHQEFQIFTTPIVGYTAIMKFYNYLTYRKTKLTDTEIINILDKFREKILKILSEDENLGQDITDYIGYFVNISNNSTILNKLKLIRDKVTTPSSSSVTSRTTLTSAGTAGYTITLPVIELELYNTFLENKFGSRASIGLIYDYYLDDAKKFMSKPGYNFVCFLFLRDQLRWYIMYRLHFPIDGSHDFSDLLKDKTVEKIWILISDLRKEFYYLCRDVFKNHSYSIPDESTKEYPYYQINTDNGTTLKLEIFIYKDEVELRTRKGEEGVHNDNDPFEKNGISELLDIIIGKKIKGTGTRKYVEKNDIGNIIGNLKTADTQETYMRNILNECYIRMAPKPESFVGFGIYPGVDILSAINHGHADKIKPGFEKEVAHLFAVDSAGNISRNQDIAWILDRYSSTKGNNRFVISSIANEYDKGGSNNKIFGGVPSLLIGNNGIHSNLHIKEFFNFITFYGDEIQLKIEHKHELLEYKLNRVTDPTSGRDYVEMELIKFGIRDYTTPFKTEKDIGSNRKKNGDKILKTPITQPANITAYFMSKYLGDSGKINVMYAILQNQIQIDITGKPFKLGYWISNDIISSLSAFFKIPGAVTVKTGDGRAITIVDRKQTSLTDFQFWGIRDWALDISSGFLRSLYKEKNNREKMVVPPGWIRPVTGMDLDELPESAQSQGFGKKKASNARFIQKANKESQRKGTQGSFTRWCRSKGLANRDGKVTKRCIAKALKSKSLLTRRRAQFAKNIKAIAGKNSFGKKKASRSLFIKKVFKNSELKRTQGLFISWCKRHKLLSVNGKINKRCINAGLKARSKTIRRRAQFLKNVIYKRIGNNFGKNKNSKKPVPTNKKLYAAALRYVKSKAKVWPSAYASGQVVKRYKRMGGKYSIK